MSHAQKRLWILDQIDKGQTTYLIGKVYIINGEFNIGYLNNALETLIARHESLRTNIMLVEGEPRQKVNDFKPGTYQAASIDIKNEEDKDARLQAMVSEETQKPLNLATDALLRVKLIQVSDEKFVFLLNIHHIISDGWSMEIVVNELISLYNSYKNRQQVIQQPYKLQYKDFAVWQNNLLKNDAINTHRNYWLNLLQHDVPVLELPIDYPRPAIKTTNGGQVFFDLGKELSQKVYAIAKVYGASTFTTLLAFTNALLYKYTGQYDIVVGSTTAGRDDLELENQIGIYANTLIFRSQFCETDSFELLLKQVKEVALNAYEHQLYPFDKIVDDLNVQRDPSRSPLFDVMIELDDIDVEFEHTEVIEDVEFAP